MGDAKTFEKLVHLCVNEENEGDVVDTNAVSELRHLIQASDVKGIQDALAALKKPIKSEKTRIALGGLQVLNQLMQNCSPAFHTAVASKDWMDRLIKLAKKGDTVTRNTIMQCLVDWKEEFKFDKFGGEFKSALNELVKEGFTAPASKAAEARLAAKQAVSPSTPKGAEASPAAESMAPPSTAEKAALPAGDAIQVPVTAGDDYWRTEAEKWRQRWESSANQIMELETQVDKIRTGAGVADPETVVSVAQSVDATRLEYDALKDDAAAMREELSVMFEEAMAQCEAAIESVASAAPAAPAAAAAEKPKKAAPAAKKESPKKEAKEASPKKAAAKEGDAKSDIAKPAGAKRSNKARLTAYFKKYNPDKVDSVDKLLASYKGKEEELFKKLGDKYGHPVA